MVGKDLKKLENYNVGKGIVIIEWECVILIIIALLFYHQPL